MKHNFSAVWGRRKNARWIYKFIEKILSANGVFGSWLSVFKYKNIIGKDEKLKVVFFCHQYQLWGSLKSVYEAFEKLENTEVILVYVDEFHENAGGEKIKAGIVAYEQAGYPMISYNEYHLKEDNPDVAFFVSPYSFVPEGFSIDEVSKIVSRCVYIPYGIMFETELEEFIRLRFKIATMYLAWKVISIDQFNVEMARKNAYSHGENYVSWGNPRLDILEELPLKDDFDYISKIKKQSGKRKIILWNTHHTITETGKGFSTWAKYGMSMIEYIMSHKDLFFIWRPHPLFWNALKKYMGEEKYDQLLTLTASLENLFIDRHESYLAGFYLADIFLSDPSSLAKEFIFMNKPVVLTFWNKEDIVNTELRECFYMPETMQDIEEMLMEIVEGKDRKQEKRIDYIKSYKKEGGVGLNIRDNLLEDFEEEIKRLKL